MNAEIMAIVSQFGAAGLLGLLWIMERRQATQRDRQLAEAHRVPTMRDQELGTIIGVVRDNTRAIVTLERTQRRILRLAERLNERQIREKPCAADGERQHAAA